MYGDGCVGEDAERAHEVYIREGEMDEKLYCTDRERKVSLAPEYLVVVALQEIS